jgi:transcriptional regulator with XRE-family HTH domain
MGKLRRPALTNNSSLRVRLGYSVQYQRVKRGWTQDYLAERADLSLKYLGQIERGDANVTIENVEILSRILNWNPFSDTLLVSGPGLAESARLILRAELKHITDTVTLVLNELEPLATTDSGTEEASV